MSATSILTQGAESKANDLLNKITDQSETISSCHTKALELERNINEVEDIFSENETLDEKIAHLKVIAESGEQQQNKINAVYKGITTRKNELDSIYYEIMGYEEETVDDETGEEKIEKIAGLKDKLEAAYQRLTNEIKSAKSDIDRLVEDSEDKLKNEFESQQTRIDKTILKWSTDYKTHSEKIRKLLPDALTAGLSSAYQEKRKAEIEERNSSHSSFKWSIFGLLTISLIPFSLNAYFFYNGKSLEQILLDLPHTIIAILPVYIPLIWIAYSSNKKANLSKRLVEEYTHKEILSKTFEGLSNQIESLGDSSDSRELRIKLLHNILDVSSENPGKLISDYNKADHPVIDALEKSAKLGDAIEKVSRIPGLKKLAQTFEKNTNKALTATSEKIEKGINSITNDNKLYDSDETTQSAKKELETA